MNINQNNLSSTMTLEDNILHNREHHVCSVDKLGRLVNTTTVIHKVIDDNRDVMDKISDLYHTDNISMLKSIITNLFPISGFIGIREGSTYCPFHMDKSHKSAKIYEDEDGVSRLYCFGQCQTQYTSYDYIKKIKLDNPINFLIKHIPQLKILESIDNYQQTNVVDNSKTDYVKMKYQHSGGDLVKFIDDIYFDL